MCIRDSPLRVSLTFSPSLRVSLSLVSSVTESNARSPSTCTLSPDIPVDGMGSMWTRNIFRSCIPSQHSVHLHIALCGRCDMEKGHRKAKRSVYGPNDYITRNRTLCLSMKGCHSSARRVWASHVAYIAVGTVSCRRRLEWGVDVLEVAPPVSVDSTGGGSSRLASKAARSTVRIFKTAKR